MQVDKLKELIRGRNQQQQQGQGTPSRAAPPPPGWLWITISATHGHLGIGKGGFHKFSDYCRSRIARLESTKLCCYYCAHEFNGDLTTGGHQQRAGNYSWGGRGPGYEQLPYPAQPQYNMPMPMPPSYRWEDNILLPILYVLAFAVNASNKVIHLWTKK